MVEADGVWQVVLVVFLVRYTRFTHNIRQNHGKFTFPPSQIYSMLPMKTGVALGMGLFLPALHIAISATLTNNNLVGLRWQQVL